METNIYRMLKRISSQAILIGIMGGMTFSAYSQGLEIVQTQVVDATPPLYTNGSMSAKFQGGAPPYSYTLSNLSLGQTLETGQEGTSISGFTRIGVYEGHMYYRSNSHYSSFNHASAVAASHGGYLLSINSSQESAWFISNGGWQAGDHMGGTDQSSEGTWVWDSGEPFSYTNWSSGEPNNGGGSNQDHMQIYANGTWDDVGWNQNGNMRVLMEVPSQVTANDLLPGDYRLEVIDNAGASEVFLFSIGPALEISQSTVSNASCADGNDGRVVVTVVGGAPPYTYEWSTGESGSLPQEIEGFTMLGEFGEKVYYLSNSGFPSYNAASAHADDYLGHMASINSAQENSWLVSTGGWSHGVYLGGTDLSVEGTWMWDSGEPFSYTNWNPGEPNNAGNEDFLQLYSTGRWNDIPWNPNSSVLFELAYFVTSENLSAGEHTLTVTDSQGLQIVETFTVGEPEAIEVALTSADVSGCGANNNGAISASVNGGTPPYSYAWNGQNASASISGLGVGTYTLTITDAANCLASAQAELLPVDIDGPTLNLQNISIELDASGSATLLASQAGAATVDDCDDSPELRLSLAAVTAVQGASANSYGSTSLDFSCEDVGDRTVFLTAIDEDGNASTGSFTLTIEDNTGPQITVENASIYLDVMGNAEVNSSFVNALESSSTDNCGVNPNASLNAEEFDCDNLGANTVTYSLADINGNVSSTNLTIHVIDTIRPVLDVHAPTLYLDDNGMATLTALQVDNNSSDNCSIANRSLSKTVFDCGDLGEQFITFTASDASGNSRSQQVLVTVRDEVAPVLEVQDIEITLGSQGAVLTVEDIEVLAKDNCAIVQKTLSKEFFTCADLGENVVVMTVTDASGNATEQSAIVTVIDDLAPVAAPSDFTLELEADGTAVLTEEVIANAIGYNSSDNCPSTLIHEVSKVDFNCDELGEHLLTYTVTDQANNQGTAEVVITLVDNLAPNAQATGITLTLDEGGTAELTVDEVDNESFDNCGIATRTLSKSVYTCADLGDQVVAMHVTDFSGNTDAAYFIVTVVDTQAPQAEVSEATVFLNETGWANLDVNQVLLSSEDNCGVETAALSQSYFQCEDAGVKQVTLTVEDYFGNATEVTSTVLVADTLKPSLSIESFDLVLSDEGFAELTPAVLWEYANDNCGVAEIIVSTPVFDCANINAVLPTEVLLIDLHGNEREVSLNVIITDTQAPELSVQDVVIELNEDGEAILTQELAAASAADNCGIANTEFSQEVFTCADLNAPVSAVFSASDAAGNTSSISFNVTVVDNSVPVIEAPETMSICANEILSFDAIQVSDNCGAQLIQLSGPAEGETLELGTYTATFEAIDGSGNTSTASVLIDVLEAPVVELGETELAENGTVLVLDAGFGEDYTYLWSTGETTQSIEFEVNGTQTVTVTVTSPNGCEASDAIVVTNDPTMSINDEEVAASISVFPNPTLGDLVVSFALEAPEQNVQLTVTDAAGRIIEHRVFNQVNNGEQVHLDLRGVAKGSYIVNLRSERINLSEQILKH